MNPNKPLLIATRALLAELVAIQKADRLTLSLPHDGNTCAIQSRAASRAQDISALHDLTHELCGREHQHGSKPHVRAWLRQRLEKQLTVTTG